MTLQIFGKSKCFETQKAMRYFKERSIDYQYVDILKYGLSKGELASVINSVGLTALVDTKSKEVEKTNFLKIGSPQIKIELLQAHPKLYLTPVVRMGSKASVGYCPEKWEQWSL